MSAVVDLNTGIGPVRPLERMRRLRSVAAAPVRRRRPRLAYGVIAVAGAIAIAAAQMGFSIATTQTSYELANLAQTNRELTWQRQMLFDDVAGLSSPQYLAANAAALGMVINESPTYLRLSDGSILGTGAAAQEASAVDAIGRGAVTNALITDTPLITAPEATIQGAPLPEPVAGSATPQAITDGLPTPTTR